jgi:hypothetical protein
MTTKITADNIEQTTLDVLSGGPAIANIQIANSSYGVLDDTAVDTAGGYIIINGSKFSNGCSVLIGNTVATSVTFVSSSVIRAQVPARSAASYVVYVGNPDGGTAIFVAGLTYSNTPVWSTNSTLPSGTVDNSISIGLSASSDSNVIYSVAAGSSLPSGVTLASNGELSGTVTGISDETTYNFTVVATDIENQEASRSFSITISAGDPFYYLTSLHLNGELTGNSWIADASTNASDVTVFGDTRPMAFSPYETVWSNFFDGNDALTTPSNSAFTYGTSDFTVEGWFYFTGGVGGSGYSYLFAQGAGTGSTSLGVYIQSGVFRVWNGSAVISSTASFVQNIWTHIAVTRSGTSMRLFVNGNLEGTVTNSNDITTGSTTGISIGRWSEIGDSNYITGYVSNFRVVKGTALYTSTFTTPTSPLTSVSGTSLLTCQSNRLIDNSTNNFTITRSGDVSVSNFGPFTETNLTSGSGYFDGSGDYLSVPASSAFQFGTGDYTIEGWIYSSSTTWTLYSTGAAGALDQVSCDAGTLYWMFSIWSGSNGITNFFTASDLNQWVHIALTRSSGVNRAFKNGVLIASATSSTSVGSLNAMNIGRRTDAFYLTTGYISDLRILKGTGLYTSAFTPPTSPLTAIANTSLLLLQSRNGENNSRVVDSSGINHFITRNGNTSVGTFSPYSQTGWSNSFDGTGDYLTATIPTAIGTGNFTFEAWVWCKSVSGGNDSIISINSTSGLYVQFYQTFVRAWVVGLSSSYLEYNIGSSPNNQWHHVAVTRTGTTLRLFFNGTLRASGTTSGDINTTTALIGALSTNNGGDGPWNGYISNLRLIRGTSLYTATFTPSNTPLTAVSNTVLLTCQSNRFIDASTNNLTISRTGDVRVEAFSPFKPSGSWSANTIGGSVLFDGTGDYLLVPDNSALDSFTDFTVEFWVFFNSTAGTQVVLDKGWNNGAGYAPIMILLSSGSLVAYASSSGSNWDTIAGASFGTMVAGQWYHIALTRSGSTIRLFTNGNIVSTPTASSSTLMNSTNALGIGSVPLTGALLLNGYLSDLRIIKGAAAYTANTSPPTAPVLPVAGTTLLINGTGGGIIDYSSKNTLETVGNVRTSRNVRKWGSSSISIGGSGAMLTTNPAVLSRTLAMRNGNFTIEAWVYFNDVTSRQSVFNQGWGISGYDSQGGFTLDMAGNSGGTLSLAVGTVNSGAFWLSSMGSFVTGTWYHIAMVRNGTNVSVYSNGTSIGSGTLSQTGLLVADMGRITIGSYQGGGFHLNGYVDDLRITQSARYTSNFTAPTSAFQTR